MGELDRIWRVTTATRGTFEVRLSESPTGDQQVILEQLGTGPLDEGTFDVDVARALARAMLEACEVASALSD